jgi:hypothetical protein
MIRSGKINNAIVQIEGSNGIQKIVLERSKDGNLFNEIGLMQTSGTTPDIYTLEDPNPFSVTYYRVKITDFTGMIIYSRIVRVPGNNNLMFSILNNPVSGNIKIKSAEPFPSGTILNIKVFDSAGKKHLEIDQKVSGNLVEIKNKLQKGTYFLKISDRENIESTLKLVIL